MAGFNGWIFALFVSIMIVYFVGSLIQGLRIYFSYPDIYHNEAVTYPRRRPSWVPSEAFLIDMHTHTRASDGMLTPEQLILWGISNGYDGLVISDHNTADSYPELVRLTEEKYPEFLVIPGVEYTDIRVHMNLIGVSEKIRPFKTLWTTKRQIAKIIEIVHSKGGLVQFNHPDWYFHNQFPDKEWYFNHGIDGFEVYNGFNFVDLDALEFIKSKATERGLFASAGTDIHDPAVNLRTYTEILSDDHSVSGVIAALKEGKTKVYCNVEEEKARIRPEKGKRIENPKRIQAERKWKWLTWFSVSILKKKKRNLGLIFALAWMVLAILASIFF